MFVHKWGTRWDSWWWLIGNQATHEDSTWYQSKMDWGWWLVVDVLLCQIDGCVCVKWGMPLCHQKTLPSHKIIGEKSLLINGLGVHTQMFFNGSSSRGFGPADQQLQKHTEIDQSRQWNVAKVVSHASIWCVSTLSMWIQGHYVYDRNIPQQWQLWLRSGHFCVGEQFSLARHHLYGHDE